MKLRRVLMPSGVESWTLIGDDYRPVQPVDRYLAWLTHIEKSPNTVKAYASDLKQFFTFLETRDLAWDQVRLEDLGEFTAWLRQPADNVIVLASGTPRRSASTVNRTLSAVTGFYEYQARNGSKVAKSLLVQTRSGQGGYKSFLAGIAPNRARGRVGRLAAPQRLPRTLTLTQVAAILAAQARFRDRLLFALMFETGMRIGQVLGLRHEDVITWEERIEIVPRDDNANRARGKGGYGSIPIGRDLIQLHHEYMHREYGAIDSDYVFINLWGGTVGRPMNYASVVDIVDRTRAKVGFPFTCHMLRHTWATLAARDGVPIEVISNVLTHRSIETTSGTYIHRSAEDLRRALEAAGVYERVRDLV